MNVSAMDARNFIRCKVVDGAIRGTYESLGLWSIHTLQMLKEGIYLYFLHFSRNEMASSGGKSTIINPFAPASAASCIALSSPYASRGL